MLRSAGVQFRVLGRDLAGRERVLRRLQNAEAVVIASGSCGAMIKKFYPDLFAKTPHAQAAVQLAAPVPTNSADFLVTKLGVTDLGARFPHRVTFHDGCHGLRELGTKKQPRELLAKVKDLELVEMSEAETCCGFGGTFAAKFPMISTAMGEVKCASALETGAEYIVSNDASCNMHIQGLANRQAPTADILFTSPRCSTRDECFRPAIQTRCRDG